MTLTMSKAKKGIGTVHNYNYSTSNTKNSASPCPTFSISIFSPALPIANAPSPSFSVNPPFILILAVPEALLVLYPDDWMRWMYAFRSVDKEEEEDGGENVWVTDDDGERIDA